MATREAPPAADTATGNPPVVFVDGDDPTLLSEAVRELLSELVGTADRTMAVEDHGGEDLDLAAIADGCATPPFLMDKRIVVIRDVGRYSTEELGPILRYLEDPLDTTSLVVVAGEGQPAPKLVAAAKGKGRFIQTKVDSRQAKDWLRDRLRAAPVRLDAEAQQMVRDHLGEDISRLVPLLDVLVAAYGEGATLGTADIDPYLGDEGSVAPWDFTDAITAGSTGAALSSLRRMLGAGEKHPLVVLAILHRHLQSMLRVDDPEIRTEAQAAKAMGIASGRSTYPAKKAF